MAAIGEIIGWKFNHEPGMRTLDGVITQWPVSLGGPALPSKAQQDAWTAEYQSRAIEVKLDPVAELRAELEVKGVLTARAK